MVAVACNAAECVAPACAHPCPQLEITGGRKDPEYPSVVPLALTGTSPCELLPIMKSILSEVLACEQLRGAASACVSTFDRKD